MTHVTTTNLADFSCEDRTIVINLLTAWRDQGLPEDFEEVDVVPMMNKESGCVFLTNSEFQVAMMHGFELESWYRCSNCGNEGFMKNCRLTDDGCNKCDGEE